MRKILALLVLVGACASNSFSQTLNLPAPSPFERIDQKFALSNIIIEYSRPGVKDRVIYGGLVPFGQVWRTGANSCTKIYFGEDVKVEGHDVPKGMYALFTIPNKDTWTIIFSKDTSLWGAFDYKQETDLLRFNVKPSVLPMSMETFTIDINNIKNDQCDVQLMWEKTMVTFRVTADIDSKIMANINEAMKGDKPPYYQAANYYYQNGKDLKQADEWINKAVAQRSDAPSWWMLKARIELKLGQKDNARASANKALEVATTQKDQEFIDMSQSFLKDMGGK